MKHFLLLTLTAFLPFTATADQADRYLEILDQITQTQKELKSLAAPGPEVCWDCVLKEKPICSFNDACSMTKPQHERSRLYDRKDGTYIPNLVLIGRNDYVNKCRYKLAVGISQLPESQKKFMDIYKQKNKKLYDLVRKNNDQVAFVDITAAMFDSNASNGTNYESFAPTAAEKVLSNAEKTSGKKLSPPVRQAWMDLLNSSASGLQVWPEELDQVNPLQNLQNITLFYPPKTADDVKAIQKELTSNLERIGRVFTSAQERINRVLDKRKTPQNAEQIETLKKRINSIKFRSGANAPICNNGPNAFYYPDFHAFIVCPQISMLPDDALFPIIAHELSHSIDPCSVMSDLFEGNIDPKAAGTYQANYDPAQYPNFVPYTYEPTDRDPSHFYFNGLPSSIDDKAFAARMKPSEYPFNNTLKCLSAEDSVKARNGDNSKKIAAKEAELKDLKDSGGTGSDKARQLQLDIDRLKKQDDDKLAERCSSSGSQMQEAFSDWMATEAFAEGLPDNESSARKVAFEGTGFFTALGCYQAPSEKLQTAVSQCQNLFPEPSGPEASADTHPFSSSRVNRIFMVHPQIKNALGCTQPGGKYCE